MALVLIPRRRGNSRPLSARVCRVGGALVVLAGLSPPGGGERKDPSEGWRRNQSETGGGGGEGEVKEKETGLCGTTAPPVVAADWWIRSQ